MKLDVTVEPDNETVWLTQMQIATLFNRNKSTIAHHFSNIKKSGEIDEFSSVAKMQRS